MRANIRFLVVTMLLIMGGHLSARASSPVQLSFSEDDYEAKYSQGLNLLIELRDDEGVAIDGTSACGAQPCRVRVQLKADDSDTIVQVTAPDVAVDAAGRARVRLTLVDGRHGQGTQFASTPEGKAHTLTAFFNGAGVPQPDVTDADCQPGAAGTPDGRLCPATATAPLLVFPDVPSLEFNQDVIVGIGEQVTLRAVLTDQTGDAALDSEAADGTAPKPVVGAVIRFAYDVNGDGRPQQAEFFPDGVQTDSEGRVSFVFTADPAFVSAGRFEEGLHAEFSGDRRYAIARTSTRVTINATEPDPSRTIIEVDPPVIPANGVAESTITVRLVDENGNILGPDAEPVDVTIDIDVVRKIDDVKRDVLDGTYQQVVRAGRAGGEAQITVTIDGEPAGTATLVVEGDPANCTCGSVDAASVLGVCLLALARRRRYGPQYGRT